MKAADKKKLLSAEDKIAAGAELMIETPMHLIRCILLKHEKAVLEVAKELYDGREDAIRRCAAICLKRAETIPFATRGAVRDCAADILKEFDLK